VSERNALVSGMKPDRSPSGSDPLRRESRVIDGIGPWLEQRRSHVTASRVGALFDVHPFLTREQLGGELRGESTKGDTSAMRRGRYLEAAIIEALKETHPDWDIERCRTYHWLPDHRIGATPDAFFNDDGIIECKTVNPRKWDEWHGAPPLQYILQTLTAMLVTGRARGVLACMVLSPDFPVHEYEVGRHPEAEQRILDAVAAWWTAWDAGQIAMPVPLGELESMLDDGSHRDLSGNSEIRALLEERRDLKASVKSSERRLGDIEYIIKNTIGRASTAWLEGWSLSFRKYHRAEFTVPAKDVRMLNIKEIKQ
jgi:predicted phage-related endonuclease